MKRRSGRSTTTATCAASTTTTCVCRPLRGAASSTVSSMRPGPRSKWNPTLKIRLKRTCAIITLISDGLSLLCPLVRLKAFHSVPYPRARANAGAQVSNRVFLCRR